MPQCCGFQCENKGVHCFPTDKKRRDQWIKALRLKNWTPYSSATPARICADHFKPDDYNEIADKDAKLKRRLLKKDAVPSLLLFAKQDVKKSKKHSQYENVTELESVGKVPETKLCGDDDVILVESPQPMKKPNIEDKPINKRWEDSIFGGNFQSYQLDRDEDDYYPSRSTKTSTQLNLKLCDGSTQTYNPNNDEKLDLANKAFGVFIGQELGNLPMFKRRYVMHQIIKLLENNS